MLSRRTFGRRTLGAIPALWSAYPGPASELRPLEIRLEALGSQVEIFWKDIASMSCTETMEQRKIDSKKGKTLNYHKAVYDYLVFLQMTGSELLIEESRELRSESKKKKIKRPSHRPLLITNGFALALLIFHPRFQSSYVFDDLPPQDWKGRRHDVVGFEHVRGRDSPSALRLKDRLYPLEWKGQAWVDSSAGHIARLLAELKEPLTEVGLQRVQIDVEYQPVGLTGSAIWMPVQARIEAATKRQLWRNTHHFSDYRRFQVETDFKIEDLDQP